MKKKLLPLAMMSGMAEQAGAARPVYTHALGEVLIYPFYTADEYSSIEVRMLEAQGAEVMDFNLYLSPFDVLTIPIIPNNYLK